MWEDFIGEGGYCWEIALDIFMINLGKLGLKWIVTLYLNKCGLGTVAGTMEYFKKNAPYKLTSTYFALT